MFFNIITTLIKSDRVLARGAATFIVRAFGALSAFILNIVIARVMDIDDAGIYFLSITILLTISMVARFGIDNAIIKFIGINHNVEEYGNIVSYIITGIVIVITIGVFASIMLYLARDYFDIIFKDNLIASCMPYIIAGVTPLALVWICSGILKGLAHPAGAGFIESASIPFISMIAILALNQWMKVSAQLAISIYVISSMITVLVSLIYLLKTISLHNLRIKLHIKSLIKTAYPIMLVSITGFLILWLPTIFLGFLTNATSVALYNVAFRSATVIGFVLVVMNSVLSPKFAKLHKDGNINKIERLAVKSSLLMSVLIFPLSVLLVIWPEYVLALFGDKFVEASTILRIICVGQIVNVISGSVGYILMMTGHEHSMKNIMLFTLLVSIILNIILINIYGMLGAAITVSFCLMLQNVLMTISVYRNLNICVVPRISSLKALFPCKNRCT